MSKCTPEPKVVPFEMCDPVFPYVPGGGFLKCLLKEEGGTCRYFAVIFNVKISTTP